MTVRRRTASHQVSAALLNAAETVLDRDGTEGVTVRAVAQEAAVSPMSVYNRFDSKEGLVVALAMRALDELADAVNDARDGTPTQRFRQACRNYRDFALRHPARYSLIFGAGSPLEDQSSAVAASGRTIFETLIGLIDALGGTRSQRDSAEAAQSVWSAVHGAVTIQHAGIGQTPDADTSFESLLDLLVAGLTGER
jgi:AcrR family transcriptional regulator